MTKKDKSSPKKPQRLLNKLKQAGKKLKKPRSSKSPLFAFFPILPQLVVIALCLGLYYAMVHYYFFFSWGVYIYYGLKLIIGYEILSASARSLALPLSALVFGLLILFTNNVYINTLMNTDTAWELNAVALVGILIAIFVRK